MRRTCLAFAIFGYAGAYAQPSITQPLIYPRGIVSAASLAAPGLPGGAIARGSLFSLFGQRVGPAAGVSAGAFPLQTTLAGVSIKITQGTTSVDAIPVFVSIGQINAIMPSNAPLGVAAVVVTVNNIKSFAYPVQIASSNPGIFTVNSAGIGPGVFQNFNAPDDQPVNSLANSATPGQAITMWATGLGPVSYADNIAPAAGDLPTQVEIFVGGKLAPKLYSGRAPCCSSTDQIVFQIPADAPLGCWVPVIARTEGKYSSNAATIAISASGGPCAEPGNALASQLLNSGKMGVLGLVRVNEVRTTPRTRIDATFDYSSLSFRQEAANQFSFNPLIALPPAGSCTVYGASLDRFRGPNALFTDPGGKYLDGGASFSMLGTKGARTLQVAKNNPFATSFIGVSIPTFQLPIKLPLINDPGNFSFNGPGGADVGLIRATFALTQGLSWTNREQTTNVTRAQGLTVNWTGAPAGQTVIVMGHSVDVSTNVKAIFFCTAAGAPSGSFTVPPTILSALPVSQKSLLRSRGMVYVGSAPLSSPQAFTATGLDLGAVMQLNLNGKDVRFQ